MGCRDTNEMSRQQTSVAGVPAHPRGWAWLEATSRGARDAAGALYLLVAAETANLLDADDGRVVRYIDDSTAEAVANADARARLTVQATTGREPSRRPTACAEPSPPPLSAGRSA